MLLYYRRAARAASRDVATPRQTIARDEAASATFSLSHQANYLPQAILARFADVETGDFEASRLPFATRHRRHRRLAHFRLFIYASNCIELLEI